MAFRLALVPGTPYADTFTIETRVRIVRSGGGGGDDSGGGGGGSAVDVSCKVAWKKPVNAWLKSLISKGAKEQLKRSYAKMLDLAAVQLSTAQLSDRIRLNRSASWRHGRSPSVDGSASVGRWRLTPD
jgi:hypothetical protein